MYPVTLLPGAVSDILASVTDSCRLTKADRYGLMAAILDDSLPDEERRAIDRLLRSLLKGRIYLTDELSMVA